MRDEHSGNRPPGDWPAASPAAAVDWRAAARATLASRKLDPAAEAELVEEIAQHLEAQCDALIGQGASADEARRRLLADLADERLGRAAEHRAPYREPHTPGGPARGAWLQTLWQDFRYGWRALVRTPAVSIVAVLSFALTIGANTAVFGLLDTVLLEPLHVPHPEQLFMIQRTFDSDHRGAVMAIASGTPLMSARNYRTIVAAPGLSQVQATTSRGVSINTGTEVVPSGSLELVSRGFFDLLGAPMTIGRDFSESDIAQREPVAIVSYDFYKRYLHEDPGAMGRVLHVNGAAVTVIGVAPRTYHGLSLGREPDIVAPLTASTMLGFQDEQSLIVLLVARAADSRAAAALAAQMGRVLQQCCAADATDGGATRGALVQAVSISHGMPSNRFRSQYRNVLLVLMGGVLVLLLLGCANVATLLVARGTAREQEFAVRASLGASRLRISRQLMVESFELAVCGTILGLVIARIGTELLAHSLPAAAQAFVDDVPIHASPALLAFTTAVVAACTAICGLLPALRVARGDLRASLTGSPGQSRGGAGVALDRMLVTCQVALALVLVSTAMLFVATMKSFKDFDFGYKDSHELLAGFNAQPLLERKGAVVSTSRRLLAAVQDVHGVDAAGISTVTPLFGRSRSMSAVHIEGRPSVDEAHMPYSDFALVTPGFLGATRIGVIRGRDFTAADTNPDSPVVIVSAVFARKNFGTRDPIGAGVKIWWPGRDGDAWMRIVGVAGDAYYPHMGAGIAMDIAAPSEMMYVPLAQAFASGFTTRYLELQLAMHTTTDPRAVEPLFRRAIASVPDVELTQLASVTQVLDNSIPRERLAATMGSLFAAIALVLATAGFFGVVAYAVVRRTREIGIRIALGARPADALWLMIREMLVLTAIGSLIGIALGRVAGNAVRAQLYGISASDPRVPIAAALLLVLVGFVASALPALRATRVDPLIALRSE